MFVDKLYVKNYRCFGSNPTLIEFSESGLTALIGPNNVGKSTILKILDILLGDKWPSGRFAEDDFHNNKLENDIVLACTFKSAVNLDIKGHPVPIKGVVVRGKHLSTSYGVGSIDIDYRLLESEKNLDALDFDQLDVVTYRNYEGKRGENPVYISQELKNMLPIVITVPLIKLQSEQPTNKWGVLGRMLQKVENEFTQKTEEKAAFEEKIKEAVKILRIGEFDEIESCIKTFWNKMKPTNLNGTELKFLDYEPWRYYRQFKLSINQGGEDVPIETLGEGVQRLAIIALYRTYLKKHGRSERAILLIEEPESYLHPQARKTLFQILKEAIKEEETVEGQIIYTTHSENFIECGDFDDIVILMRKTNTADISIRHVSDSALRAHTVALGQSETEISDQHIHYRLIETISRGLKEALFAHKAVIVEGPSEIELFRFFSHAEKNQIGIVSAGGKSNIPAIYTFLTAFGIPCLVIIDRDSERANRSTEDNSKIAKILNQENADTNDETKVSILLGEINDVKDGDLFSKERLMVLGKNLETVLSTVITGWAELLKLLRESFNLPDERSKPGPRDIQALGLVSQNVDLTATGLRVEIEKAKPNLEQLSKTLNEFIMQEVKNPSLLIPKCN